MLVPRSSCSDVGVAITASGGGGDATSAAQAPATTSGTTPLDATTTTTGGVDISGPCDEAEYANDPRCTGVPGVGGDDGREPGRDVSGPCGRGRARQRPALQAR